MIWFVGISAFVVLLVCLSCLMDWFTSSFSGSSDRPVSTFSLVFPFVGFGYLLLLTFLAPYIT